MLTAKQKELLLYIHERIKETGVSPSFDEMKEALDLASKSGIHRLITALEERGFLRRVSDASDRRSSRLSLTARGRRLFEQIAVSLVERDRLLLGSLSARERHELNRLLNKISVLSSEWPEA